jgi:nitroreductase
MDTVETIAQRRSIRKFLDDPVPRESLEKILETAILAPSAKNRQPWRFVVLEGDARSHLAELMLGGARAAVARGESAGSCEGSARVVAQAPVTVLVFNAEHRHQGLIFDQGVYNAPDIQSIGGMVQTMLLAAQDLGLGSLWICDVLFAYPQIRDWLGRDEELVTAVSLGYAAEAPPPRPRMSVDDVTEWRS